MMYEGTGILNWVPVSSCMSFNNLTDAQEERLIWLFEEVSEVVQAVARILRHGPKIAVGNIIYNNIGDLEKELGHMKAAVNILAVKMELDYRKIDGHAAMKSSEFYQGLLPFHHQDL